MKVNQIELDRLHDEFLDMRDKKNRIRREVERRYRDKIEEEIEFETRTIERVFAVRLVEVKEAGATRKDLVKVIGDGTASTMRHYIELGGGTLKKHLTGSERAVERQNATGVRRVTGNRFIWTVDEVDYEADLLWQRGKPVLFPVGGNLVAMRDAHGIGATEIAAKGEEVASAFNISETN